MNSNWLQADIRWVAVLASLLLSISTVFFQDIPNADAYTYVRTAEIFLNEGIAAAYQHYSWATYSILIAVVSWLGIDLFSAGLLVNALFYAILVFAFISIMQEINDTRPLLILSAICILVYPQLNEYRGMIVRDIGFWGLSMFAFWQYLLYAKTQLNKHAFIFSCTLLLAASFRAEALVYLIVMPFALLLDTRYKGQLRRTLFFRLIGILLSMAVLLLIFLLLMGLDIARLLVEFVSIYEPFIGSRFFLLEEERVLLGTLLFNEYAATFSREYIEIYLVAGMLSILLANLVNAMGGPYLIVLATGFFKKQLRLERHIAVPVIICLTVNFLILFSFLFITRYLSSRYAMLLCLLLTLLVPLIIFHIYNTTKVSHLKNMQVLIGIFLTYCAIDSFYSFGESKTYVSDSIEWIAQNTDVSSKLVTNNHAIAYFSGKVENYDQVQRNFTTEEILSTNVGDTIAAEMTPLTKQILDLESVAGKLEYLAAFPDEENRRIALFRRVE